MGSPLILEGGKTHQLGAEVLHVNTVEQLSGNVLIVGKFNTTSLVAIPCTTVINVGVGSNTVPLTVTENSGQQYVADFQTIDLEESREKGIRVINGSYNEQIVIESNTIEVTASSFDMFTSRGSVNDTSAILKVYTGNVTGTGPYHSGNVSIFTGSSLTTIPGNVGIISLYTGVGDSNGGIVLETNGGSTYTPNGREIIISSPTDVFIEAGVTGNLYLAAKTKVLAFNSATDSELVNFLPTTDSIVGALNELKSETSSSSESFYTPTATPDLNVTSATPSTILRRDKHIVGPDQYTELTGSVTVEATAAGKCALTITRPPNGLNSLVSLVVSGHDINSDPVTCAGTTHSSSTFMLLFNAPAPGPFYQISFTAMYRNVV